MTTDPISKALADVTKSEAIVRETLAGLQPNLTSPDRRTRRAAQRQVAKGEVLLRRFAAMREKISGDTLHRTNP